MTHIAWDMGEGSNTYGRLRVNRTLCGQRVTREEVNNDNAECSICRSIKRTTLAIEWEVPSRG